MAIFPQILDGFGHQGTGTGDPQGARDLIGVLLLDHLLDDFPVRYSYDIIGLQQGFVFRK
jgi:hypothetical protein